MRRNVTLMLCLAAFVGFVRVFAGVPAMADRPVTLPIVAISGIVVDSDKPVANAIVLLSSVSGPNLPPSRIVARATSAGDGKFTLSLERAANGNYVASTTVGTRLGYARLAITGGKSDPEELQLDIAATPTR